MLLLSALVLVTASMWAFEVQRLQQSSRMILAKDLQQQFNDILGGVFGNLSEEVGILLALWPVESEPEDGLPQSVEAYVLDTDIDAIIQLDDEDDWIPLYGDLPVPISALPQLKRLHKGLWCDKKGCMAFLLRQRYDGSGQAHEILIFQRLMGVMDKLRHFVPRNMSEIFLTYGGQLYLSTDFSRTQPLFPALRPLIHSSHPHHVLKNNGRRLLLIPLKLPFTVLGRDALRAWLLYDITRHEQQWNQALVSGAWGALFLWGVVLGILALILRDVTEQVLAVKDGLTLAESGQFKEAFARLKMPHLPLFFNELHSLRQHARRILRRMGSVTHQMQWMVYHDTLTKLHNRRSFYRRLKAFTHQCQGALVFIDLNRFKQINDVHGHAAGDAVLQQLAQVLQVAAREFKGEVFRLAGDEFTMIFTRPFQRDELASLLQQLALRLRLHRTLPSGEILYFSGSVGGVLVDGRECDQDKLLHWADIAMYQAKRSGRNWHLFDPLEDDDTQRYREELALINEMRQALEGEGQARFSLVAQPIVPVSKQLRTQRYEVLLRFINSRGEGISPADFIPLAERHGLIHELDRWVLRQALEILAKCPDKVVFSVNLSAPSMQRRDLPQLVREALEEKNADPKRLVVELTETAYVDNLDQVRANLRALSEMGVRIALDDFGMGFSSFSYLSELPLDYVKLDGSYIRDLDKNETHRQFVSGLCQIVHAFGMAVVAEFVENEAIMQQLRELQVDYAQGWHIGKPQPIESLFED